MLRPLEDELPPEVGEAKERIFGGERRTGRVGSRKSRQWNPFAFENFNETPALAARFRCGAAK